MCLSICDIITSQHQYWIFLLSFHDVQSAASSILGHVRMITYKCIYWVSPFLIKCIKNSLSIITVFPYDSVYTGTIESRIIMRTIILRWSVNPRDYSIHLSYFTCMCDTVQYLNSHVTWSLLNLLMTIQMNERLRALHVNTRYCTLSKLL